MYKTLILLLLVTGLRAQDSVAVLPDFESPESHILISPQHILVDDGRVIINEIPCQINNGDQSVKFKVSVICQQKVFAELGLETVNRIILEAFQKGLYSIDPTFDYLPAEIRMAYNPALKDWSLTNRFSIRDDKGNENATLLAMDFDASGQFRTMKRVY